MNLSRVIAGVARGASRNRRAVLIAGVPMCVLWTLAATVWPGVPVDGSRDASSNFASILTIIATISAAAIAVAVTAGLIGVQLLSRYGARANRLVIDAKITGLLTVGAALGIAAPLWGAAEQWSWLRITAFAGFAWAILVLAAAVSVTLTRLDATWLVSQTVRRLGTRRWLQPDLSMGRLAEAQRVLLEIAAAAGNSNADTYAAARGIALVGFARYRVDPKVADTPGLIESLSVQGRSPKGSTGSPAAVAGTISLLASGCEDRDVTFAAINALQELVEDAVAHRQAPAARDLLEEAARLVTGRLQQLLDTRAADWLISQDPIERSGRHLGVMLAVQATVLGPRRPTPPSPHDLSGDHDALEWLYVSSPPRREDLAVLHAVAGSIGGRGGGAASAEEPDAGEADRASESYDLLEAWVTLAEATCASPAPDDGTWAGGWRGVDGFSRDLQRLASIGETLYKTTRLPPADRIERTIEKLAVHCLSAGERHTDMADLPDATGWRLPETVLSRTSVRAATEALAALATDSWTAGFDRRAIRTLRRLGSLLARTVRDGHARTAEEVSEDFTKAVLSTAKWSGKTLAARARARQLVLALAPELQSLARMAQVSNEADLWERVFDTADTVAWAPDGNTAETSATAYLQLLSGTADEPARSGIPGLRSERAASKLNDAVRGRLLHQIASTVPSAESGLAIVCILALWSDAIVSDSEHAFRELANLLERKILAYPRRDFCLPELWEPIETDTDRPPQKPASHWRLFDVASEATRWIRARLETGGALPPTLPPVGTPDGDLRALVEEFGEARLIDERCYWGVTSGNDCLVYLEEADRSRRLLRDHEGRARGEFAWGYGGTGPHNLAQALVEDILGPLINCPSCFGMVAVAGGLVQCPLCADGLRGELGELRSACAEITARLSRKPDASLVGQGGPDGAEWRLTRTGLLTDLCERRETHVAAARHARLPRPRRPSGSPRCSTSSASPRRPRTPAPAPPSPRYGPPSKCTDAKRRNQRRQRHDRRPLDIDPGPPGHS
jgi:hypothetical protein